MFTKPEKFLSGLLLATTIVLQLNCAAAETSKSDLPEKPSRKKQARWTTELTPGVKMELVWIKGGTFRMGSPDSEIGRWGSWGEKQRKVVITRPYYIAVYETTQEQYMAVMDRNPSKVKGENLPVTNVSWQDAMAFCEQLNRLTGKTRPKNYKFTLPTEAQWEYPCRAGTNKALNNNKDLTDSERCRNLDEVGWYAANSQGKPHPVGQKKPNKWGLYDMHGNAWEFCLDYWAKNPDPCDKIDPQGPSSGENHVKKGGGFYLKAERCRSASRSMQNDSQWYMSFRVALVYAPEKSSRKHK